MRLEDNGLSGSELCCLQCGHVVVSELEQYRAEGLAAILDAGGHLQGHRKGRRESCSPTR
jgi:hypothetical protein